MFTGTMQVKVYVYWNYAGKGLCLLQSYAGKGLCLLQSYAGKDVNTEHLRQFSLILIQFRGKIFQNTLSRIGTKKNI